MNRVSHLLVGLASVAAAASAGAQVEGMRSSSITTDAETKIAVTAYAIRYNKLAMSSQAQPGANYIPAGIYKDDMGHVITVVDGRFTLVKFNHHITVDVETTQLTPERRVQIVGRVVGASPEEKPFPFPAGSYRREDGKSAFTVVDGRPTKFVFPALVPTTPTTTTTTSGGIRE